MNFRVQTSTKETRTQFIGKIPNNWNPSRLGFLTTKIGSGKTPSGGAEIYLDSGILFLRSQNVYDDGLRLEDAVWISKRTDEEMPWSRVLPGDILLNITGASIGRTCLVPDDFPESNVNQHVCIIRLRNPAQRKFLSYYLKSQAAKSFFDFIQNGAAREGLNFSQVSRLDVVIPPDFELEGITNFLEMETAKIDALVAEQEKLIALLQEKRQALISHAVTKGLDPKAEMKDSGVECLGKIPAHWKSLRFKFLILKIESGTSVNATDIPAVNGELGVLKTSCVYHGDFDPAENKAVLPSEYARVSCPVRKMHLVVSRMNTPDLVGSAGLVKLDHENLFLPDRLWQVSVHGIHPALCHYWTLSYSYRVQVQMACSGTSSSMQNLSQDQFKNFFVPIPPAPEQLEILKFIEKEISKINLLSSEAEKAIGLLRERRAALITAAVTGKIDVRGLA